MNQFSRFLYELRKEKNLTQSELAKMLGITNKAVSKWETGEAMPDTAQLLPLAEIFGVSVDELLRGERDGEKERAGATAYDSESPRGDRIVFESDKDRVEIESNGHVYINGERAKRESQTLGEKISVCVCAALMAVAILVYMILGTTLSLWHPLWCIPASAALGCGIVSCAFDLFDRVKKERKRAKGENPYTGGICGIVMCASLIIFLCVASVLNNWHIMWISPVAGVAACMIIGTVGGIFSHKKEK